MGSPINPSVIDNDNAYTLSVGIILKPSKYPHATISMEIYPRWHATIYWKETWYTDIVHNNCSPRTCRNSIGLNSFRLWAKREEEMPSHRLRDALIWWQTWKGSVNLFTKLKYVFKGGQLQEPSRLNIRNGGLAELSPMSWCHVFMLFRDAWQEEVFIEGEGSGLFDMSGEGLALLLHLTFF